jgi:hypothetical protein
MLRIRTTRLRRDLRLPNGSARAGDPVVEIHLWNEHIRPMPPEGADLAWAAATARQFASSMRALARCVAADPVLSRCRALGGPTFLAQESASIALLTRLGFQMDVPRETPNGFVTFWKNLYAMALLWTFNPPSLHSHSMRHLQRVEVWMAMEDFLRRYGRDSATDT